MEDEREERDVSAKDTENENKKPDKISGMDNIRESDNDSAEIINSKDTAASPAATAVIYDEPENRKLKLAIITVVSVLFVVMVIFVIVYFAMFLSYNNKVNKIVIGDIVVSELSDGVYCGLHDVGFINAEVKVTVKEGKIDSIVLVRHKNDKGEKAEEIIYDVIREQTLKVDGIAGATNSSKTILKAIENALRSEPQPL